MSAPYTPLHGFQESLDCADKGTMSSKSGSADVLEALGVKLLEPAAVEKCIEKVGFGFMFAQYFHPAMRNAAGVRKELA